MNETYADIERHTEAYLARLMRVIEQPSVSTTGEGVAEMAAMLVEMFRAAGLRVELAPTGGAPVVLARIEGRSSDSLLFYNHYDVQPVDPLDQWTSPPFEPTVRDGKLFGRGVADNKGAIIARLCAIESYLRTVGSLPVSIDWVIEGEEEIGSLNLARFVDDHRPLLSSPAGCVWEAGGRNAAGRYEIALGCKGLLYVELRARGAGSDLHSALAAIVDSPVWRLLAALQTLRSADGTVLIDGFADDVRPPTPAQRRAVDDWDFAEEEARAVYGVDGFLGGLTGAALKERLILGPTCNIDGFCAGYCGPGSKTVLPASATAKLDFRLVPNQRPERIAALLRAHLDAAGYTDVEIAWSEGEPPAAGDPEHPFVQLAVRTAEAVYGHSPAVLPLMTGTGPIHLLCDQFGVPVVTAGVAHAGSRGHAPDENIHLADFVDGIRYIAALLNQFEH